MTRTALLVIDVQNANTADAWDRDGVISRIGGLIDRARAADVPVLWIQHEEPGSPLARGADGWEIVAEVRPGPADTVIAKRYFDAFVDSALTAELEARDVDHLVVCGASTDACIRTTSGRIQSEGYDLTLVADGHTASAGPWPMPLPDGTTVPIGAEQMVAYTNFFVGDTAYPDQRTDVVNAADVSFR